VSGFFKSKLFIFLLVLTIVCGFLMALSSASGGFLRVLKDGVNIVVSFFQSVFTAIKNFFMNIGIYFKDLKRLEAENIELKEKIAGLKDDLRYFDRVKNENKRLRTLLNMTDRESGFEYASAEVIGRESSSYNNIFIIDSGTRDGVVKNAPVITSDGLVGKVSEAGTTWAQVSSVLELDTTVGAIVSRSREIGIVEGNFDLSGDGLCRMNYLTKDADIKAGDTVETSGLGGMFPKGILIGTVKEVYLEENGISSYAIIEPSVDIEGLKEVFIITAFEVMGY
jgi:rod shape-determining protein MreC